MNKIKEILKNERLLKLALTQKGADSKNNNERLEFIGDRVLGLVIADLLLKKFKSEKEGELARRHSVLVSTNTLSLIAKKFDIESNLKHGFLTSNKAEHLIANAMEAIIGAIYLDAGYNKVFEFIKLYWNDLIDKDLTPPKDSKTLLQEMVQHNNPTELPIYKELEVSGKIHNPTFHISVSAFNKTAIGIGNSKKQASINAAYNLLKTLAKTQS